VTVWLVVTEPAVAVKVALVAPAAIVTDAGTVNAALFEESTTVQPPADAAGDIVTVQDDVPPEITEAGAHCTPETTDVVIDTAEVAVLPFSEALRVAVWLDVIQAVVAVKLPVVAPAATVTDAGTVSAALFEESATAAPPTGAAAESVTVQLEDPPDTTVAGEHCRAEAVGRTGELTVIVPPAPVTAADVPSDSTPITLLSGRDKEEAVPLADSVTFTTAIAPAPMAFAFLPDARQITVPAFGLQDRVLPAAVSAGPAEVVTDVMSLVG
jgi:hypothetical protein